MDCFPDTSWDPELEQIEHLISSSEVRDSGLIPDASNYVFLLELDGGKAGKGYAVYKPMQGETPLWDFPPFLYKREAACYIVSKALGWNLVPPTVVREEGLAYGMGSVQLYIPTNHNRTFFDLRDANADIMRQFATFDYLINNADRKGGHIIQGENGRIWGIDNGLSFHVEEKLRTVIWDYAGESIAPNLIGDLERLASEIIVNKPLKHSLSQFLDIDEIHMLRTRALAIIKNPLFPHPPNWRRPYPWPLI